MSTTGKVLTTAAVSLLVLVSLAGYWYYKTFSFCLCIQNDSGATAMVEVRALEDVVMEPRTISVKSGGKACVQGDYATPYRERAAVDIRAGARTLEFGLLRGMHVTPKVRITEETIEEVIDRAMLPRLVCQ